jgi:tetratricopeptide (TPR) repeat protein
VKARLQEWVYRPMRILLSRATYSDRDFSVGLGFVVILAAVEIFSASFYYISRIRAGGTSVQSVAATIVRRPATSVTPTSMDRAVSQTGVAPSPVPSLVDRLLTEATELRDRGDTTNALARLHEALERDPKNPSVLEEMAKTYESMQLFDRSNETWRRLQELGPSTGAAYELADRRLKPGVPTPAAGGTAGAGIASGSLEAVASRNDVGGIPEGSTFGITEVKTTETPDPDTETNLMLRIGIKKQPNATIDHTKVKIQVFFYDTVDDKDIKLTDADVNYEWLTPKHDWTDTNPEILAVSYLRPKNKAISSDAALSAAAAAVKVGQKGRTVKASSSAESGERRYLGYRVLVYYNDKLQAVQAEPARLLQLFPPSESILSP